MNSNPLIFILNDFEYIESLTSTLFLDNYKISVVNLVLSISSILSANRIFFNFLLVDGRICHVATLSAMFVNFS